MTNTTPGQASPPGAAAHEAALRQARAIDLTPSDLPRRVARLSVAAAAPRDGGAFAWARVALVAAAAAGVVALVLPTLEPDEAPPLATAALQVGPRVLLHAGAGSAWRVVASNASGTTIAIDRHLVTLRLVDGGTQHSLDVLAGGARFTATGTVFSVEAGEAGPRLWVHEGTVQVERGAESASVSVPGSWPVALPAPAPAVDGAAVLGVASLAPIAPPPRPEVVPAPDAAVLDAPEADAAPRAPRASTSMASQWRRARRLRAEGKASAAAEVLRALGATADPTWAPLALVEEMRIHSELEPNPERVLALVEAFEARYPSHGLAPTVRDLACEAKVRLGRSAGDACER